MHCGISLSYIIHREYKRFDSNFFFYCTDLDIYILRVYKLDRLGDLLKCLVGYLYESYIIKSEYEIET